ncbi:putative glycolipid-binding domain-containing protein [Micromonospora sp. CPCC 206060]|uniref:putative glycolipid-binding domain-containing protein n=1 Tax=Micromonospora sp. CPCC 206060 TaxID=3122406 RepID=UPI002FF16B26
MPTLPKSLFWTRTDTAGCDHARLDDRRGLTVSGVAQAVDPVPHTCRYEVATDTGWATTSLAVEASGAGWFRSVHLERAAGRWRVTTAERGDLNAALVAAGHPPAGLPGTDDPDRLGPAVDVDLGAAPLFNSLPVRRLGLLDAEPGTERRISVAWVLVPSLLVVPTDQVYTALGGQRVRYASDGFTAELDLDPDGYVRHYPGLAELVGPGAGAGRPR